MRPLLYTLYFLFTATVSMAGPRLAVLDFTVASSDPSHVPLGQGLRSMLSTDLSRAPDVVVVERERLEAVLDELKLQDSKAVDAGTAVEVGRLLGATHLIDGSVTVSGERMRLDVRLVDIERGNVVLGEQIEGERLAFFELEKDLAKQLITALAVQLAPKERAKIGKVHTADWDAFVAFSQGVSAFDERRYEEAMAALDRALVVDGEFALAELTQQEYGAIVERLENRSTDLRTAKIEMEKLEQSKEVAEQIAMLEGLQALAALKGEEHRADRLTALAMLHALYTGNGLSALRSELDRFQGDRLADHYLRRYTAEVQPLIPEVRPDPTQSVYIKDGAWKEAFDTLATELNYSKYDKRPDAKATIKLRALGRCRSSSSWGAGLYLDFGERAIQCKSRMELGKTMGADLEWQASFAWGLWSRFADTGQYSEATKLLLLQASVEDNARTVESTKSSVEGLRDRDRIMKASQNPDAVREAMMLGKNRSFLSLDMPEFAAAHLAKRQISPEGRWGLSRLRSLTNRMRDSRYLLVGDTPFWPQSSYILWTTGPRPDPIRTESLIYHRPEIAGTIRPGQPIDGVAWALYGDHHQRELTLELTVSTAPGEDWWPQSVGPPKGRPSHGLTPQAAAVGILLGARDVDVGQRKVPGEKPVTHRPFKAWVVTIDASEIRLETLVRVGAKWKNEFERSKLASVPRKDKGGSQTQAVVNVDDAGKVSVALNGRNHTLRIPEYQAGFVGFYLTDTGYAELSNLKLR
ncbi:MAG: CsgG/HfaB family protein [Myxococcota bacterium]